MRSPFKKLTLSTVLIAASAVAMGQALDTTNHVETRPSNSGYQPAFVGQTRIHGVQTKMPVEATVINSDLKSPWGIHVLPDGRLLITGKQGSMQILKTDGTLDKQITGFPKVLAEGQGGMLDVNIDPDFAHNRMIYWDYAEPGDNGSTLAIAKGKLSADETQLENVVVIYRATPSYKGGLQYGSRILFDKKGDMFVSTGERGAEDIRVKAQDLSATIGKVIHITKDGKPVPNGPFAKTPGAKPEIYAYGFRNPEGMAWNPVTGELWEDEFGPRGGDEINIVRAGNNYGWPYVTYGMEYSGKKVYDGIQQKEGITQPIYYWDPSISPSGITFYTGNLIPEWKNNLLVGGLGGSQVARLVIKDNHVIGEERMFKRYNERWRALTTGQDGAVYAVTDGGKLYRIAPAK